MALTPLLTIGQRANWTHSYLQEYEREDAKESFQGGKGYELKSLGDRPETAMVRGTGRSSDKGGGGVDLSFERAFKRYKIKRKEKKKKKGKYKKKKKTPRMVEEKGLCRG